MEFFGLSRCWWTLVIQEILLRPQQLSTLAETMLQKAFTNGGGGGGGGSAAAAAFPMMEEVKACVLYENQRRLCIQILGCKLLRGEIIECSHI
ncbi:hypothetical protein PanWU01x14_188570 [Parasponia andersonii]|uniref:Uncharacterized protein n=1 Tax=Parasponia andersonii TaxID=3476 RepID=A0A2P5C2R2_PARAD|nr:hypothetical protein PanWU01x14_188570 [Parasponia andersonii]